MAAVSVTAQNTRLDDAEALTNWVSIGAGPGAEANPDFFYQNSTSVTRQGTTSRDGIALQDDVTSDISGAGTYNTVIFKAIITTPGVLDTLANRGMSFYIGHTASDVHVYDLHGNDTYPADKSWLVVPIDPNIASHRSSTNGTPNLTIADYYGMDCLLTASVRDDNCGLDAVDIGAGLTLVGGDGADADGVWQDFADHDFGTINNRYGYIQEVDGTTGTFLLFGNFIIGTATATVFNDTGRTVMFPDGLFADGFSVITVDLQTATTDVDFIDTNFFSFGTEAGEDTRADITVTGTSGAFDTDGCTFDGFDTITLTSACTITGGRILNCEALTQAGATLDGIEITDASTADGVAFITATTLATISNCDFTFSDGHAIEITATGTYTFTNNQFTGYGADGTNDAAIYNNSGGSVTINVGGGGSTPTVRNGAGASTTVNNTVTLNVTVVDEASVAIQNARVAIYEDPEGPSETQLMNELTDATGLATEEFNFVSNITVSVRVRGADLTPSYLAVNSTQTITSSGLDVTITLSEDTIFT